MENSLQNILITKKSADYELLDSGGGEKLERYGAVVLSRPDPQAIWQKSAPEKWETADAVYTRAGTTGKWQMNKNANSEIPEPWQIELLGITFSLKLLPSKHLGLFPEQSAQWSWLAEKIASRISPKRSEGFKTDKAQATTGKKISVLNLFAYTGGASLACAKAGAQVAHVDASQFVVDAAVKNRDLSGLSDAPIRFIVDDARKFVEREIKRGNTYDIIVLDPPVYGKGNLQKKSDQVWKIEEDLLPLLLRLKNILSPEPVAVVLNGYASGYSHITYGQMLQTMTRDLHGTVSSGELAIAQSDSGELLPCGIFARWEK